LGKTTTAAMLSRLGRRVLAQHYVPGGFTHTFKRTRWSWDVGVHAVDEVDAHAVTGHVLRALTRDQLQWTSPDGVYDEFYFPDLRIDFPDNKQRFEDNLLEAFPAEADGMRSGSAGSAARCFARHPDGLWGYLARRTNRRPRNPPYDH
jgi:all-trans-retinol 13,14-reductase